MTGKGKSRYRYSDTTGAPVFCRHLARAESHLRQAKLSAQSEAWSHFAEQLSTHLRAARAVLRIKPHP